MNQFDPTISDAFSEKALKETINKFQDELKKDDETLGTLITTEEGDGVWVTKDGYVLCIDKNKYYPSNKSIIEELQKSYHETNMLENDIKRLKRKIKHSKHPMEKKYFEEQLNLAYKRRKLNKKGISIE